MDESDTPECWLPLVGYEGFYEVSDLGRVRRLERRVEWISRYGTPTGRVFPGHIVRAKPTKQGYPQVALSRDGKARWIRLHTVVLTAFRGPRPDGLEALHADDDKGNNRLSNLRWGTPTENRIDCVNNGHHHYAIRDHCKRGHLFAGPNLLLRSDSGRRCRSCTFGLDRSSTEEEVQRIADAFYRALMGDLAA